MELVINGVTANLAGWKRAKLEKALIASYNEMCDMMNAIILPMYNHVWTYCMGNDAPVTWDKNDQIEYEGCENEISQDIWSYILQTKYGYRYAIQQYYLSDIEEKKVEGRTVHIACQLHIYLDNVGE